MQLQKWTVVNRRWFAKDSRPSKNQWLQMIRNKAVAGKIIMDEPMIDIDHFAATNELTAPGKEVVNLLE